MYSNRFNLSLIYKGQVLNDRNGKVEIPFGAEYTVRISNKNGRKVFARIYIDGEDIGNGRGVIIDPKSHVDIERFINGYLNTGQKLKFVTQNHIDGKEKAERTHEFDKSTIKVITQLERPNNLVRVATKRLIAKSISGDYDYDIINTFVCDNGYNSHTDKDLSCCPPTLNPIKTMTIYCTNCGSKVTARDRYCSNCGKKVR